jgi:hypothetical protein
MFDVLVIVVVIALVIEKLVEQVKTMIGAKAPPWVIFLVSAALGIAICTLFSINIFPALGLESELLVASYFGYAITGLICGCGSNFTHDLIGKLRENKSS